MESSNSSQKYRILIVDDNHAIHDDFKKILCTEEKKLDLDDIENELFGSDEQAEYKNNFNVVFELDDAFQGKEALDKVQASMDEGRPYALAFVDMRMPPGWDGLETIERIWAVSPEIQIVICSAYSDHSWSEISTRLGNNSQLLVLKKPFERIEIIQAAHSLTQKWELQQQTKLQMMLLDAKVNERTALLEQANCQLAAKKAISEHIQRGLRSAEQLEAVENWMNIDATKPMQNVDDSIALLRNGFDNMRVMLEQYQDIETILATDTDKKDLYQQFKQVKGDSDLHNLFKDMPEAFNSVHDSTEQLVEIVSAMKKITHTAEQGVTNTG